MSRISVRGFAVASATAVTAVGSAVGVASGDERQDAADDLEVVAADATLLAEIPAGTNAQLQTASLTQQAETQSTAADAEARIAAQEAARLEAAANASAKKEAEEEAEREAREAAEAAAAAEAAEEEAAAASEIPVQTSYTVSEVQAIAQSMVPADQFTCFSSIVDHESGWDHTATNPYSGAYGLMQALPGSKMASAGADWQTNPATQIEWGLMYMGDRYGSPCGAWEFWQANGWY
ncbi:transglycosylase SLT domain-containing protein [Streptomyces sp. 6N223]|uniref:aggregation-promoting factor C-terminal-like domain-containing protein n=1 Tax=Streptomyces sp. 6N223 TaxID=3457412 RepID=UPI003FCFC280